VVLPDTFRQPVRFVLIGMVHLNGILLRPVTLLVNAG
jgi:hypothetical protein